MVGFLGCFEPWIDAFGQRCADKIRPMESIGEFKNKNLLFEELEDWLKEVEAGDRRTFLARGTDGKVLAFLDITGEGENFVSYDKKMQNIHGERLR